MHSFQSSNSIAVLPLVNRSSNDEMAYFADGMTEEIINALTRINGLRVTSRVSSFYYKDKELPVRQIARELKTDLIVQGSVRVSGNVMRISAQLIQAEADYHFWSDTWDRQLEDVFAVQDEISLIIAEKAREYLGHFEIQEHLVVEQTSNFRAYEWYLKGRFHFRHWNPDDANKAIECYDEALRLDSGHAESMLGKADALSFLATTGFLPAGPAWEENERLVRQALAINDYLADGYYLLANLYFFKHCDFSRSLEAALHARELHPNHPETNQYLSFLYILAGERQEAANYLEYSLKVDPKSSETRFFEAYHYYMTHQFERALHRLEELLAENIRNVPAHSVYCYCLLHLGRYEEALRFFDRIPSEVIVEEDRLGIHAIAYILKGEQVESDALISELETRAQSPEGFRADSFLLFIYSLQNNIDAALAWVEKAVANRSSLLLIHLNDPFSGNLLKNDRYQKLLRGIYRLQAPKKTASVKSLLNEAEMQHYCQQLDVLMDEQELYLDSELSLRSLARKLDIHPNKLSWLINQQHGKNFNRYLNAYRIAAFKKLAVHPANSHLSIIGLAYESGFNSKTVFNTSFKQETGLSPKAWMEQR